MAQAKENVLAKVMFLAFQSTRTC